MLMSLEMQAVHVNLTLRWHCVSTNAHMQSSSFEHYCSHVDASQFAHIHRVNVPGDMQIRPLQVKVHKTSK